jgi:hypothetical protein
MEAREGEEEHIDKVGINFDEDAAGGRVTVDKASP